MDRQIWVNLLKQRWLLHSLFWLVFGFFYSLGYIGKDLSIAYILQNYVAVMLLYAAFIYSCLYIVYGYLVSKGYYLPALVSFVILLFGAGFLNAWLYNTGNPESKGVTAFNFIPFYAFLAAFTIALKMARGLYLSLLHEIRVKENLLSQKEYFLRSQIQPHFLFNTLNNFYGLALDKSEQLPDLMLRLSSMLRHQIYNSDLPHVSLQSEVSYLKDYIELEKIRYAENLSLDFSFPDKGIDNLYIMPAVLIVFLENAFKHGKGISTQLIEIKGHLRVEGDYLDFYLENTFPAKQFMESATYGGLGLANVRKRLELLGTENFELQTEENAGRYIVHLRIKLKSA
jgi:two-component system, LytTR family, sensor kinase